MEDSSVAEFWKRGCALIIDVVILLIFCVILEKITNNAIYYLIVFWLYFSVSESSKFQATVGKRLVNISVADYSLKQISFLKASVRFAFKVLPLLLFVILKSIFKGQLGVVGGFFLYFLLLGYCYPIFDRERRALQDIIAGTIVLNKTFRVKKEGGINEQVEASQIAVETESLDSNSTITEGSKPSKTENLPKTKLPESIIKNRIRLKHILGSTGIFLLLAIIIWPLFKSQEIQLPQVPETDYDRFVKGQLPITPQLPEKKFDPSTLTPEVKKLYDERKSAAQVSKLEPPQQAHQKPVPPPRKQATWPTSVKADYISRCVSNLVSQGLPEQYARPYAACIANGMEKEFGMEEYNQMMNAEPNPKGSAYDRRLYKVFESCSYILPKY
jgi:uncharacterized RDD family membrane protein YckC